MAMRRSMLLAPIMLVLAGTAHAQGERPMDPYDPPIVPQGNDMRPMGDVYGGYARRADTPDEGEPNRRCGRAIGCVVIINTTEAFDVVSFQVDLRAVGDARGPRWDLDLMKGIRLRPRKSLLAERSGDSSMCNQQVRVVMQHRRSGEQLEGVVGTVNLCDDARHQNIVFPVRVLQGRVTIEPDS